jgi:uncharacterized protein (TIGR02246 family)
MSKREIAAGNRLFAEAAGRRDVDAIANLYTKDAIVLPPEGAMVVGRDAVRNAWKAAIDEGFSGVKIESIKVEVSGDIAVDVGHASMVMKSAGAPTTTVEVKFMAIWKKTRGQWRIHRDMWSPRAA